MMKQNHHIMVKIDSQKCMLLKLLRMLSFIIFQIMKKNAANFKETLLRFSPDEEPNLFFSSVIYGIYYLKKK